MWNTDSWWWKIAVLAAIFAIRETVRATSSDATSVDASLVRDDTKITRDESAVSSTRSWIEVLDSAMIAFAFVFFIVLPLVLQSFYIPSGSMENTLRYRPTSDKLLVAKWIYRVRDPQFLDVVVFHPPPNARANLGEDYIKRCIGVPGDVIEVRNKQVFRNGKLLRESYVKWSRNAKLAAYDMKILDGVIYAREYSTDGTIGFWQREGRVGRDENDFPYQEESNQQWIENAPSQPIPAGQFLVLGDHRNESSDGHVWGLVPRQNFVGKAMCVFWPPNRIGTLDRMSQSNGGNNEYSKSAPTTVAAR